MERARKTGPGPDTPPPPEEEAKFIPDGAFIGLVAAGAVFFAVRFALTPWTGAAAAKDAAFFLALTAWFYAVERARRPFRGGDSPDGSAGNPSVNPRWKTFAALLVLEAVVLLVVSPREADAWLFMGGIMLAWGIAILIRRVFGPKT